ncbi:MAG TPA: discoidin domain-containing protein [Gemmatimonadaceae bacterium]|nr:discoidin domain-containing protein [Gemmatimonadaceae bacterium]
MSGIGIRHPGRARLVPPSSSLLPLLSAALALASGLSAQSLDGFDALAGWQALPSDGVKLEIRSDSGRSGRAMRLDFDFQGGGGYAIARKSFDIALPENYEFTYWIRGDSPVNTLEFKLVDPSGENVWWRNLRDFEFPRSWRRLTNKKRHIEFAWGPIGGGEMKRVGAIEIVVTASHGGKGSVWIDDLSFTRLEPAAPYDLTPEARATSAAVGAPASRALDGDSSTVWRSAAGGAQVLTVDFLRAREFGGLVLHWAPGRHATHYAVETSRDGKEWEAAYTVHGGNGGRDYLYMPESEARFVRLALRRGAGDGYAMRELTVEPLEWSATRNAFLMAVAREAPRGSYPKYVDSVQSYWTVIGENGGMREALINEEGAIEVSRGGFSIEPFLQRDGKLLTWADGTHRQSLEREYLPIPTVERRHGDLGLAITAFAANGNQYHVRYRVTNHGQAPATATLYLAIRAHQVNPPWQFLNNPGGVSRITSLSMDTRASRADSVAIAFRPQAARVGVATFDNGDVVEHLRAGRLPVRRRVTDARGLASGASAHPMELAPGASRDVWLDVSVGTQAPAGGAERAGLLATAIDRWAGDLEGVEIELPSSGARVVNTLRSTLAYILINRDGPAIQPGSRSYERSWIRDGSLTSAALLRFGHAGEVRRFIEWYTTFQYPNGKVPCCVDHRGADPVAEHDSHGQLIYLIAEYHRYTKDRAILVKSWPNVVRAVAYIDSLRQSRMTEEYRAGDKRAFFGLVPESISHEGYSAKPMHSFWDDFFVLRGLKDATYVAGVLGHESERRRFAGMRDDMRKSILESFRLTMAKHGIGYLPGSVELGDFDATSTTVAIAPGGELPHLPIDAVRRTFDRYWEQVSARRTSKDWDAYTPYELRTVGTFVRLGQKERAHQLLEDFFRDQRPAAWNHWAEVVWRDPKTPKFIGDMPHTWVGSDYIRSVMDMFVYEREEDEALVLGAGIPERWVVEAPGVRLARVPTYYGTLAYRMSGTSDEVRVRIESGIEVPPGGIVLRSPFGRPLRSVLVDGRPLPLASPDEVMIRRLPAEVTLRYR